MHHAHVHRVEAQFEGLEAAVAGDGEPSADSSAEAEAGSGEAKAEAGPEAALPYTLAGVSEKIVRKLVDAGFATVEAVAAASAEQLSEVPGVGGKTAEKILAAARGETPAEAE